MLFTLLPHCKTVFLQGQVRSSRCLWWACSMVAHMAHHMKRKKCAWSSSIAGGEFEIAYSVLWLSNPHKSQLRVCQCICSSVGFRTKSFYLIPFMQHLVLFPPKPLSRSSWFSTGWCQPGKSCPLVSKPFYRHTHTRTHSCICASSKVSTHRCQKLLRPLCCYFQASGLERKSPLQDPSTTLAVAESPNFFFCRRHSCFRISPLWHPDPQHSPTEENTPQEAAPPHCSIFTCSAASLSFL